MELPHWRDHILAAWPLKCRGRGQVIWFLCDRVCEHAPGTHARVCLRAHFQYLSLWTLLERKAWLMRLLYSGAAGERASAGLQSHGTGTLLTSPLFTEWSERPKGCWLENNKCCYWCWGPNAHHSLCSHCSHSGLDMETPTAQRKDSGTKYDGNRVIGWCLFIYLFWSPEVKLGNQDSNVLRHASCSLSLFDKSSDGSKYS